MTAHRRVDVVRSDVTLLHDLGALRVRADELSVLGLRLGDPVARLRDLSLHVLGREGDAHAVEGVLASGGWVRASHEVAIEIEGGRIRRFSLSSGAVARCVVEAAHDITCELGAPTGLSWRQGARVFHYVARQLQLAWHPGQRRLLSVTLGHFTWREPEYGARELLRELSEHLLAVRRPRSEHEHARRARVNALATALGYASVENLLAGELLSPSWSAHAAVLEEMRAQHRPELLAGGDAGEAFLHLLGLYLLTRPRDSHRIGSDISGVMRSVRDLETPSIGDERAQLERWLAAMLDPSGRRLPERELVRRWGWPDVELAGG